MPQLNGYPALTGPLADDDELAIWDTSAAAVRNPTMEDVAAYLGSSMAFTIASSEAPARIKRRADYVVSGNDDGADIQTYLTDHQWNSIAPWGAPAVVQLSPGVFDIRGRMNCHRGQTVEGIGGFGSTVLSTPVVFNDYVFGLSDPTRDTLVTLRNFYIDGQYKDNGGIHFENWNGSFGDPIPSGSDSVHVIDNIYFQNLDLNGIWLDGTGGSQNSRGNRVRNVRMREIGGHGILMADSSDNYLHAITVNTNRGGNGGHGFYVAGGSNKLVLCKAMFTDGDGFHVTSSRALMDGCYAQDNGAFGYNLLGPDPLITGCTADSANRLSDGDSGIRIAASGVNIQGSTSLDRNTSYGTGNQEYGIRYVSGNRLTLIASAEDNQTDDVAGSLAGIASCNIELMGSVSGYYERKA